MNRWRSQKFLTHLKMPSHFSSLSGNPDSFCTKKGNIGNSGGSRRRGTNPLGRWAPTYNFAEFAKELHEIENFLGHRGAPLDPSLALFGI